MARKRKKGCAFVLLLLGWGRSCWRYRLTLRPTPFPSVRLVLRVKSSSRPSQARGADPLLPEVPPLMSMSDLWPAASDAPLEPPVGVSKGGESADGGDGARKEWENEEAREEEEAYAGARR